MENKKQELQKETQELILKIQKAINPGTVTIYLGSYIANNLRYGRISLYEAYILKGEEICLKRGKGKNNWRERIGIRICLEILNQRMLAILYGELEYAERLKEFGLEAMRLNEEKREHIIMDEYENYLDIVGNEELLKRLEYYRDNWETILSDDYDYDDDGPLPVESFPYEYCALEKCFLSDNPHLEKTEVQEEIEDIIVEIALKGVF